jgi:hypothetical protein
LSQDRASHRGGHAGISEDNVDSPLHLGDALVKTIKVGQLGDVALNSRNVCADCLHGLVGFLLATTRYEDIGTLFDEKFAVANPIPSVPPVMTAVLPSSFLVIAFLRCC